MAAKKTSKSNTRKPPSLVFEGVGFCAEISAGISAIRSRMPLEWTEDHARIIIRDTAKADHDPTLWHLAYLMLKYSVRGYGVSGRRFDMDTRYPFKPEEAKVLKSDSTARVKNALSKAAIERLRTDVAWLCHTAAGVGDHAFFQEWGTICNTLAGKMWALEETTVETPGVGVGKVVKRTTLNANRTPNKSEATQIMEAFAVYRNKKSEYPTQTQLLAFMKKHKGAFKVAQKDDDDLIMDVIKKTYARKGLRDI